MRTSMGELSIACRKCTSVKETRPRTPVIASAERVAHEANYCKLHNASAGFECLVSDCADTCGVACRCMSCTAACTSWRRSS